MATYQELLQKRAHAVSKADRITSAAEHAGRKLTADEEMDIDTCMDAVQALNPQIAAKEKQNTLRQHMVNGMLIPAAGNLRQARTPNAPVVLGEDYYNAFHTWIGTHGQQIDAALYEGAGSAGGYAVPVIVDGQIVPLAPC